MSKRPQYEVEDWQAEYAKTNDKRQADANYIDAKLRNAKKREEYRLGKETFLEKILGKLFKNRDKNNPDIQKSR